MYYILNFHSYDFEYYNYKAQLWTYADSFVIIAKGKVQLIKEFYRLHDGMTKTDKRELWKICRDNYLTHMSELKLPISI